MNPFRHLGRDPPDQPPRTRDRTPPKHPTTKKKTDSPTSKVAKVIQFDTQFSLNSDPQNPPINHTKHIFNLSKLLIDTTTASLLTKGLKFIPHFSHPNLDTRLDEAKKAKRKIILAKLMHGKETSSPSKLPIKSSFNPQTCYVKSVDLLAHNIHQIIQNPPINNKEANRPNITPKEKKTLFQLAKNDSIIIKKADKSSTIVIMDHQDYVKEAHRQLFDPKYYKLIQDPRQPKNAKAITRILNRMAQHNYISEKELNFLLPKPDPRPRIFYGLPKIHKPTKKWHNNFPPLRPIVSDCSSESYEISRLLDIELRPVSITHPSYIKDTFHFLQKLGQLHLDNKEFFLITCDVESLYTNIPHAEGIKRAETALFDRYDKTIPTSYLKKLLSIILYNNDFTFAGQTFLQTRGTSMGARWAPAYANIYMAHWEKQFYDFAQNHSLPQPICWYRYLDDIFIIWPHSTQEWDSFFQHMNNLDPHIKFTSEISPDSINFLDVNIFKNPDQNNPILHTKTYFKPTDHHLYLHANSSHPPHCKIALIKGMFIRIKRICSRFQDFIEISLQMKSFFLQRGYRPRTINKLLHEVINNQNILPASYQIYYNNPEPDSPKQKINLVVTYQQGLSGLQSKISTIWHNHLETIPLHYRDKHSDIFGGTPRIALKRPRNLADYLIKAKTKPLKDPQE